MAGFQVKGSTRGGEYVLHRCTGSMMPHAVPSSLLRQNMNNKRSGKHRISQEPNDLS